ncbi:MAG: hypothetical protein NT067_07015 [Candidatus Diapherotrites archaeon]|nr:hypothetical protein [Candidatus Diapherotrites archaeon]
MAEKRVAVRLLGEAKEEYLELQETVRLEKEKGISSSFHQTLLRSIDSKIALLKANYDYGIQIPKKFIPRKYSVEYGVTNLWKVNLSGYWRLIYTLKQPQREQTEIEIISIWLDVLDIINHKKYDKIFRYRKK